MTVGERFVGQRVLRHEDPRFLTGHGRYVDDIPMPGTLHVAFVRSDIARGRIVSVDTSEAATMPGVVAVFAAGDLDALVPRPPQRTTRSCSAAIVRSGCSPTATSAASASRSPWSSPTPATAPRTPSTRSWSRSTPPIRSSTSRARSTPTRRSCTRAPDRISGTRFRRRCRRPSSTRVIAVGAGRADRDVPPASLRDGADGDARHPRELGAVRRAAHRVDLHARTARRALVPRAGARRSTTARCA